MRPKATVIGWYGHKNIGDDAYQLAFPLVFPGVDFTFVDDLKPGSHHPNIILGGGNVFDNCYLGKLKNVTGKKYAMSINCPDKKTIEENIDVFDKIFFREQTSFSNPKIKIFPDFAFALKSSLLKGRQLIDQQFHDTNSDRYEKIVVVIINAFLIIKDNLLARDYLNFEKMMTDLANIFDNTKASFLFLPFTDGFPCNDRITNGIVYSRCKFWKKNSLWLQPLTVQNALDICAAADLVISSRLHGGIFSTIGGTPFIDLTHHSKTEDFLHFINRPSWSVNYWKFDYEKVFNTIRTLLDAKQERFMLYRLSEAFRNELNTVQSYINFAAKV